MNTTRNTKGLYTNHSLATARPARGLYTNHSLATARPARGLYTNHSLATARPFLVSMSPALATVRPTADRLLSDNEV